MLFGIPTKTRVKSTEKYNKPVMTASIFKGKGTSRSFTFNKAAIAAFGLGDVVKEKGENRTIPTVAFSFNEGKVFIVNTTKLNIPASLRLGSSTLRVSDRPTYEYILDLFSMGQDEENEFELIDTGESYEGQILFELLPISEELKETAVTDHAVAEADAIFETEEEELVEEEAFNVAPEVDAFDESEKEEEEQSPFDDSEFDI